MGSMAPVSLLTLISRLWPWSCSTTMMSFERSSAPCTDWFRRDSSGPASGRWSRDMSSQSSCPLGPVSERVARESPTHAHFSITHGSAELSSVSSSGSSRAMMMEQVVPAVVYFLTSRSITRNDSSMAVSMAWPIQLLRSASLAFSSACGPLSSSAGSLVPLGRAVPSVLLTSWCCFFNNGISCFSHIDAAWRPPCPSHTMNTASAIVPKSCVEPSYTAQVSSFLWVGTCATAYRVWYFIPLMVACVRRSFLSAISAGAMTRGCQNTLRDLSEPAAGSPTLW
mmetsp:Transcript_4463/g.11170  ORF Transcript_4463/g.11170 Transcript_4463/m.11170 type:complete len:282 (-) Transcript_4463:17-862(-)